MESAFWTQAANAVLPPLVNLIDPLDQLFLHLLSRFAKTQVRAVPACLSPGCCAHAAQCCLARHLYNLSRGLTCPQHGAAVHLPTHISVYG